MVKDRGGFTFIEVMIVLGISSLLLMSAVSVFAGQQRRTQLSQSMREMEAQLQDIFNDVSTGFYPTTLSGCTSNSGTGPSFTGAQAEAGSSISCLYVGKAIHFQERSYTVHSLAGNRYNNFNRPVSTFWQSFPTIVPNVSTSRDYQWGVEIARTGGVPQIYIGDTAAAAPEPDAALMLVTSTTKETALVGYSDEYNSGLQRVALFLSGLPALYGSPFSTNITVDNTTNADINSKIPEMKSWPTSNKVTICFEDADEGSPGRLVSGVVVYSGNEATTVRLQNDTDEPRCR